MTTADHDLLVIGAVFLVGIVASRVADRLQLPDVGFYLLAGAAIGPAGLKLFSEPSGSVPSQIILTFGAGLILYEGGRNLDLQAFRRLWPSILLLATLGVAVSTVSAGLLASWAAGLGLPLALLAAAVLSPTDPAIVMPVMRQVGVRRRLALTASSESALNDATGAALAVGLLAASGGHFSWVSTGLGLLVGVAGGLGSGVAIGFGAAALVSGGRHGLRLFGRHEHGTIMSLVTVLAAYLVAQALGASGFMAVFAAGVVNGNKELLHLETPGEHEARHGEYLSLTAMIMRMMIFVLLGSQVDFAALVAFAFPAGVLVVALLAVARPLAVVVSLLPDRRAKWCWNEIVFLFWVRETGVIPAALAGLMSTGGVPGAALVSSAVFLAIVVTVVVQATTTRFVARHLGVLESSE